MANIPATVSLFIIGLLVSGCVDSRKELGMVESGVDMQSVCVGRYAVSLPAAVRRLQKDSVDSSDATFYFGHGEDFTKVDVSVFDAFRKEGFESAVLARKNELSQARNFSTDGPMLISSESIQPGVDLIMSYGDVDSVEAARVELHFFLEGMRVVLGETAYSSQSRSAVRARLISIMPMVRPLQSSQGAGSGFCIGSIVFDFNNDYEEADVSYSGIVEGSQMTLQFDVNTFRQSSDEPSLIRRGEANLVGLGVRPEKLRAAQRMIAGDAAEEWLGVFTEDGHRLHGFYAETDTLNPTPENPKLLISMSTGGEKAQFSGADIGDDKAVAIWDEVLASIRKRGG